jgi:hypothetical protein
MPEVAMQSGFLFRPKLALEIAGIDPATFNKIVADKFFTCARPTEFGKARPFNENDVIAAFILARLLEMGLVARQAGPIACEFYEAVRQFPDEPVLVFAMGRYTNHMFPASKYDPALAYNVTDEGMEYAGVTPVMSEIRFNIAAIRKVIAARVAEWNRTLGAPDDDE